MALKNPTYRDKLKAELAKRRRKNPAYSSRAFAKLLGVPSGRLSEILAGKRNLSRPLALQFAQKLGWDDGDQASFLKSVAKDGHRALFPKPFFLNQGEYTPLPSDAVALIAGWEHWAILSLIRLDDFRSELDWIAKRLGISPVQTKLALFRLQRLGLIEQDGDGSLRRTHAALETSTDIPSSAIRKFHKQSIEQAVDCLERVPIDLRDITAITFPANLEKMAEAKEIIRAFRRKLSRLMESGQTTEVYNLNVQLVPVTRMQERSRS